MKNNLKETIAFVGLSYKKELTKILLANLILMVGGLVAYIFIRNNIILIMTVITLGIINFFLLTRYDDKKRAILKNRENELVSIISYFEVYIQNNNNVYQSFLQLLPYCSDWMKENVNELLTEIDNDKSIQPFVNFANKFTSLSIHSLMLSIYQMVDQGENSEQLTQFNIVFDELSKNRHKEIIEQKEKALTNMSTFPLIGAGLITITLTISILSILGDLINVI